jgi:hypothetical protein
MLAGALGRRASIRPQRHDHWMVVPNLWGGQLTVPARFTAAMVAVPINQADEIREGVYHEKLGLFSDAAEDIVATSWLASPGQCNRLLFLCGARLLASTSSIPACSLNVRLKSALTTGWPNFFGSLMSSVVRKDRSKHAA